jgi:hypothetical protein
MSPLWFVLIGLANSLRFNCSPHLYARSLSEDGLLYTANTARFCNLITKLRSGISRIFTVVSLPVRVLGISSRTLG